MTEIGISTKIEELSGQLISIPEPGSLASCLPLDAATKWRNLEKETRPHYAREEETSFGARSSKAQNTHTHIIFIQLKRAN